VGGLVLSPVSVKTPNCGRVGMEIWDVGEDLVEEEGDGEEIFGGGRWGGKCGNSKG
jgi:hypothetical protein